MLLKNLIKNSPKNIKELKIKGLALNSKDVKKGFIFFAIKGTKFNGENYIDKAISIDPNNIIAHLSKGIWHAEIIGQAGKTLAKAIYGADLHKARYHFLTAYNLNNDEIGVLYELAYGYHLLGTEQDIDLSLKHIKDLINKKEKAHIDKLYKNLAFKLKKKINLKD